MTKIKPFWNSNSKKWSKKMWLPTDENRVESKPNNWSQKSKKLGRNSWFSTEMWVPKKNEPGLIKPRINIETSIDLTGKEPKEIKQKERIKKRFKKNKEAKKEILIPLKTKKIKLNPNKEQKQVLEKWFGICRWTYNQCVNEYNKSKTRDQQTLRKLFIDNSNFETTKEQKENNEENPLKWVLDASNNLRDEAVSDFIKALNSNDAKIRKAKEEKREFSHYKMHFKTKKQPSDSIVIRAKDYEDGIFYNTFWKLEKSRKKKSKKLDPIQSNEEIPEKLEADTRLVRTRFGQFYLCVLQPIEIRSENQAPLEKHFVSLDQGVRTFVTTYGSDQLCTKWGQNDFKRLASLSIQADRIQSLIDRSLPPKNLYKLSNEIDEYDQPKKDSKKRKRIESNEEIMNRMKEQKKENQRVISKWKKEEGKHKFEEEVITCKKRSRLRKTRARIFQKIRDLVRDLHCHLVKWLCENYTYILIPKFETKKMVNKLTKRKINSKTARSMLTWSFYQFRQRLLSKSREYPWVKVIVCTEEYTSKTCTNCGFIHKNLGGNKVFKCPDCGTMGDRDIFGARDIFLKYLTEHQSS